ncbi:hypothetical protein [Kutzneria sp. CA-103260]|uniref:hypothetical protein n=1 Tax=Kutzneria sp. CA-103260 TaxID=2802641 RepID=UPI001BAD8D0F|nr:hypothetical protein [Kutzneria sp. CA-103260]QUQ65631.1 hypothetical protein JJ691_33550 [Kutzneria sp. CA-103260]
MSAQTCGCRDHCGHVVVERNRYFTGKFMAARDFAADTEYLLDRHRLHNRLLHGWGIVCGLEVCRHPRPECAKTWVVVTPGLALDCHGRELVLQREIAFELPQRSDPFLLCVRFHEEQIEPVPSLFAEGACDPHHREFNRFRDGVELVVADVTPGCWPVDDCGCHHSDSDEESGSEEAEQHHHGHGCGCHQCHEQCLEPRCPCGDLVPLARVIPLEGGGFELDFDGRRVQPPPPALLTHITHVNWKHGGCLTLKEIREELHGELRICFDRPLRESHGLARGVNPQTFVVQYSTGPAEGMEFLPYPEDSPPRLEDPCTAVFTIDEAYIAEHGRRSLHDVVISVSLRCDFIQDCRGVPVDGNHLRGRLPSGDGVQGGLFESWFEVRDEDHDDRKAES